MTFPLPLCFALGYSEAILQALDEGLHFLFPQLKRITMRADCDEAGSGSIDPNIEAFLGFGNRLLVQRHSGPLLIG